VKLTCHSLIRRLLGLLFAVAVAMPALARQPLTFQYFYDEP
jgi:hypothetical protein